MGQPWIDVPGVEILEEIGRGAYGAVYRARSGSQQLALKIPHAGALDAQCLLRLRREGTRLARISHPSIPRVMQIGQSGEVPYLLMDLVDGFRLSDLLQAGPLSESQAVTMGIQVGEALARMHEGGLTHRDVHPRNVLFDRSSTNAFLVDFGMSTYGDDQEVRGVVQLRPRARLHRFRSDVRQDLLNLGRLMVRAVAPRGTPDPKRFDELVEGTVEATPELLAEHLPDVSPEFCLVVAHLLREDVPERYETMAAFVSDLRDLARIRVGGQSRRLRTGSRNGSALLPHLVGRKSELDLLGASLSHAQRGTRKVVCLDGASGSGKSLLIRTFVDEQLRGDAYLLARCEHWDPRPFAAVRQLLDDYLFRVEALPAEDRTEVIHDLQALGADVAPLLRVLSPQLASLFVDSDSLPLLPHVEDVFVDGLAVFLSRWTERGRPVLIDDAQWLDPGSKQVLIRAIERGASGLFLFAARTEPEYEGSQRDLRNQVPGDYIASTLKAFSRSQIDELTKTYLGSNRVSPALTDYIARVSDRTPFEVLSILHTLLDHGALSPVWGHWVFDRELASRIGLTAGAREAAERRLSDLSSRARTVLEAAAVLGSTFSTTLLKALDDEDSITTAIEEAEDAFLLEIADEHRLTFRFAHDQVREALLEGIAPERRSMLHGRIASAMDRLGTDLDWPPTDAERLYSIAHHHIESGLRLHPQRTYQLCLEAAQLAMGSCDTDRALRFFRAAEEIIHRANLDRSLSFHQPYGETLVRAGALRAGLKHLGSALQYAKDDIDKSQLHLRIAWVYHAEHRATEAWSALDAAFAALGSEMPKESLASALRSLGSWIAARLWLRRPVKSENHRRYLTALCELFQETTRLATETQRMARAPLATLRVLGPAERLGPSAALSKGYLLYSFLWMMVGWRRKSDFYGEVAEKTALAANDPSAYAYALQVRCAIHIWGGRLDDALTVGGRCVTQVGHWQELCDYCVVGYSLQWLESLRGRAVNAWPWMERAAKRLRQNGESSHVVDLMRYGVRASLAALGRDSEAATYVNALPAPAAHLPLHSEFGLWAFGPRIRVYTEQGNLGSEFAAIVSEFQRGDHRPERVHLFVAEYYLHVVHARVHAALRADEPETKLRAIKALRRAYSDFRKAARIPLLKAHALAIRGYLYWFEGKKQKAENSFLAAEKAGRQEKAPWVLYAVARGRAHMLLADGNPDIARVTATIAAALARESGHVHWLRWVREEFDLGSSAGSISSTSGKSNVQSKARPRFDPRHLPRLRIVADLQQTPAEELKPELQIRRLVDELIELFGAERGDVFLRSSKSADLQLAASRDARRRDADGPGIGLQAFYDHAAFSAEAVFKDAGTWNNVSESVLALPLFEGDQCMGLIGLASRLGSGVFSDSDVDRLNGLSHQIWATVTFINSIHKHLNAERVKAEEVSLAQASYRTLLTSVSDPVLVIDQDSLLVVEANQAAARLFGRKEEHLLGVSFDKLAALDSHAHIAAAVKRTRSQHEVSLSVSIQNHRRTSLLMRAIPGDRSDRIQCVFREEPSELEPTRHLN